VYRADKGSSMKTPNKRGRPKLAKNIIPEHVQRRISARRPTMRTPSSNRQIGSHYSYEGAHWSVPVLNCPVTLELVKVEMAEKRAAALLKGQTENVNRRLRAESLQQTRWALICSDFADLLTGRHKALRTAQLIRERDTGNRLQCWRAGGTKPASVRVLRLDIAGIRKSWQSA
jgi:hypothetical protein